MNYYIQGDAAKADQIKAAFERNGIDTSANSNYGISNLFYYSCNGEVAVTQSGSIINIIKTHPDYKELELPVEFKNGDIIGFNDYTHNDGSYVDWVGIYKRKSDDFRDQNQHLFHCVVTSMGTFRTGGLWRVFTAYPATKEQRDLLFKKMREEGYRWDAEKKELRKIQPHYDISNFYAGMPVLVRADNVCRWDYSVFSRITGNDGWPFAVCNGVSFSQCIPFNKDTEHLLGTNDMCSEEYINWRNKR